MPHLYDGVTLKAAATSAAVPYRTAQRWPAAYKQDGLRGLARAGRSDKGRRRLHEELIAFIEGLALKPPRPTVAKIHRQAVSVAAQRGRPRPGYGSVHEIVIGIDPALQVMAHEGTKRWVIDSSGKPARPWLTAIEDDHSRAVAGYAVNLETPSALTTALVLRHAIWRKSEPDWHVCGIPDVRQVPARPTPRTSPSRSTDGSRTAAGGVVGASRGRLKTDHRQPSRSDPSAATVRTTLGPLSPHSGPFGKRPFGVTSSLRSSSGFAVAPRSVSRIVTERLGSPTTSPNPYFSPVRTSSALQLSPEQVSRAARVDGLSSTLTCLQAPSQHTSIVAALASAASGPAMRRPTPTGVPIAVHGTSDEQPAASSRVSRASRRTLPQTNARRAGFTGPRSNGAESNELTPGPRRRGAPR
ncbi:helix-turn-helix domain-containing protein [Nonomuraea angiospora]|uniref:helix-turn-helix domain-containing protein n=1 Tax=Nonomuraea angiospora TaxID=46172 RepID=UPI00344084CB